MGDNRRPGAVQCFKTFFYSRLEALPGLKDFGGTEAHIGTGWPPPQF